MMRILQFIIMIIVISITVGGCRQNDITSTPSNRTVTMPVRAISTATPLPINTSTPSFVSFVKPILPSETMPSYLLAYYENKNLTWLTLHPDVIGIDDDSETVYLRTFTRNITFLHGLLPTNSIHTDSITLYDWNIFKGVNDELFIPYPHPAIGKIDHDFIIMIQGETLIADIETTIDDLKELYYEQKLDILYAIGSDKEGNGQVVAYQGQTMVREWQFPGRQPIRIVGDGRGYVYIQLKQTIKREKQGNGSWYQDLQSIAVLHKTDDAWYYLMEDSEDYLFLDEDKMNLYVYYVERHFSENPQESGIWHQVRLIRDGEVVAQQQLPYEVNYLGDFLLNPSTKQFYTNVPRLRDNQSDNGVYPVFTVEDEQLIFEDPINLRIKEPYPGNIKWAFDIDLEVLYGLDLNPQNSEKFVYVVRDKEYVGRFPIYCDHPHNIHVNSVTSLIYVSCNFEVQVFAYQELISPALQAQIEELKATAPEIFEPITP